ncbi:MAG: glycosyltransferase family 39 protein [Planctomycetaceae bacterium]|nr:glycosyltransferase family 39 protein [Planctomycetaceae bacterium]
MVLQDVKVPANVQNTSFPAKYINACLIAVFLVLVSVTVIIRIQILSVPLERDEGEYAYSAQLMLQGVPPYTLAYNMKMPGIYAAYAVILAVFGQTAAGIHFGVLLINTTTVILIYFLAKKLFNSIAGVTAAVFFAITSLSQFAQATANAENFVVLPAMAAILLLMKFTEIKKLLYLISGGLLMGIAFMMKQHAIGFILFGYCFLLWNLFRQQPRNYKKSTYVIFVYSFFVILPFLFTCLVLCLCGVFEKFWFWTFDYANKYVSLVPLKIGFIILKKNLWLIVTSAPLIWLLAALGLLSVLWNKDIRRHWVFLVLFLICSFLAVCPGLYFRYHYFVLFLPVVAIFAGAGIVSVESLCRRIVKSENKAAFIGLTILLAVWLGTLFLPKNHYFEKDPAKISQLTFGSNGFPEMQEIAKYIKEHSNPTDQIAVLGSEPEIFFYSQRRSASPYIYMYPLMEAQPYALVMQREMIEQIENCKPRFFIFVTNKFSWLQLPKSEMLIFTWFEQYMEHYRSIGLVEILPGKTLYYWGTDAVVSPKSSRIYIFERKDYAGAMQ